MAYCAWHHDLAEKASWALLIPRVGHLYYTEGNLSIAVQGCWIKASLAARLPEGGKVL